jgi:hypothetical protein
MRSDMSGPVASSFFSYSEVFLIFGRWSLQTACAFASYNSKELAVLAVFAYFGMAWLTAAGLFAFE